MNQRTQRQSNILFIIIPFVIFACAVTIFFIQIEIDNMRKYERVEGLRFLLPGRFLKPMVLGYDQLAADILWLKIVQLIGEKEISVKGYDWIYHVLDVVTDLDPKFDYAYQAGGIVLATLGDQFDKSNALLEKGLKENPDIWQIPFYLGFNHFFYLGDYKKAADYMAIASRLPGHPHYLPRLTAKLYVHAKDPDTALEFLARMHSETTDERAKKKIEERAMEVIAERDITFLEDGVKKYVEIYKRYPDSLEDLVAKKIINMIPKEPFGGYYYIDEETKGVKSSAKTERLKRPRKFQ